MPVLQNIQHSWIFCHTGRGDIKISCMYFKIYRTVCSTIGAVWQMLTKKRKQEHFCPFSAAFIHGMYWNWFVECWFHYLSFVACFQLPRSHLCIRILSLSQEVPTVALLNISLRHSSGFVLCYCFKILFIAKCILMNYRKTNEMSCLSPRHTLSHLHLWLECVLIIFRYGYQQTIIAQCLVYMVLSWAWFRVKGH